MSTQTEAQRLADWLSAFKSTIADEAAAELRRLAGEVQRLQFEQQNSHEAWVALSDHAGKLRAEVEALRADAERYRWLRNRAFKDGGDLGVQVAGAYDSFVGGSMAEGLDAAIDAARAG